VSQLEFRLPDVGEGLSEGEIVEWHVEPGTRVTRDQVLVDVETDKSIVQLPSPVDGAVVQLGAAVGDVLNVGDVLVVLETEERVPTSPAEHGQGRTAAPTAVPDRAVVIPPDPPAVVGGGGSPGRRALASPATRKLALELGVDLAAVTGSGPGGRVSSDDVTAFAAAPSTDHVAASPMAGAAAGPESRPSVRGMGEKVVPLRGLRRQIAKTMTKSWREVPHITEFQEFDATGLVAARTRLRPHLERDGVPFTFLPLFVKAIVATLAEHPKFNASVDMDAEAIIYHGRRNIGLATATEAGLIVPVLKDADTLSLSEIAGQVDSLAGAARSRTITNAQMSEGTFTITNFGTFGGWIATPIIRPPEAAIAGFGRIRDAVVAVDGAPVVRPTLPVSVSADHRLIDGDDMSGFLNTLGSYLVDPILMLEAK